jgi:cystathionine gamma-synthase
MSDERRNDAKADYRAPQGAGGGRQPPVVTPIQPSVVYASPSIDMLHAQYEGRETGYTYAREGHPNATLLAEKIDELEGAEGGIVTGSGMAAVSAALMGVLKAGDHVIGANQLYGRSLRLMNQDLARFGIATSLADPTDIDGDARRDPARDADDPGGGRFEPDAQGRGHGRDRRAGAGDGRSAGGRQHLHHAACLAAVRSWGGYRDPLDHEASGRPFGRHAGLCGGAGPGHARAIYDFAVTVGFTPSPYECWLAERGLYTFPLRYDRAEANARRLAEHLASHPKVARVLSRAAADHPDAARAAELLGAHRQHGQFRDRRRRGGGEPDGQAAPQLPFAPTLGDVGTTLSHPASSSHRALTPEAHAAARAFRTGFSASRWGSRRSTC